MHCSAEGHQPTSYCIILLHEYYVLCGNVFVELVAIARPAVRTLLFNFQILCGPNMYSAIIALMLPHSAVNNV